MLNLKYASPQIGSLTGDQKSKWSKALLLKIHVITGWVIPEKELLNILVDQFEKKLAEDYGHLNVDEVEYAFRKFGTTKPDWGKQMNLSMIDDVLIPYSNQRMHLSAAEERKNSAPLPTKIYTDQELDNILRGDIETFYQQCRKGILPYSLPEYFKDILVKDGLMKPDEKLSEFLQGKLNSGVQNIYVPVNKQ